MKPTDESKKFFNLFFRKLTPLSIKNRRTMVGGDGFEPPTLSV
jgi:hypothetical protein